jgi:hypothetical protein
MSGAKMGGNCTKMPFAANNDRPSGASTLATSLDVNELQFAVATGNRQTKRLALRQLGRLRRLSSRLGQTGGAS